MRLCLNIESPSVSTRLSILVTRELCQDELLIAEELDGFLLLLIRMKDIISALLVVNANT